MLLHLARPLVAVHLCTALSQIDAWDSSTDIMIDLSHFGQVEMVGPRTTWEYSFPQVHFTNKIADSTRVIKPTP
jgi:hypothetical protein